MLLPARTSQGSGLVFGFRAAVSVRSQQKSVPKCMRARPDASTSANPIPRRAGKGARHPE